MDSSQISDAKEGRIDGKRIEVGAQQDRYGRGHESSSTFHLPLSVHRDLRLTYDDDKDELRSKALE